MNAGDYGPPRPRPQPNGNPPGSSARPYEHRNGATASAHAGSSGPPAAGQPSTRAEKFEDEKQRIIESCFGKKEADGSLAESYITHVRIEEDAAYPSTPPPTNSPPDNKKSRIIVVAVRKSGRVRMHKGRENVNGTFSIGKTWVLDDLTSIESFTNAFPNTAEEQQNKQRAGTAGFIVTIQKPYYWQAGTAKEKDFFIFSLIKIYRKYTGGRLPELQGFSDSEKEQLGGPLVPSSANAGSAQSTAPAARAANQEHSESKESRPRAPNVETQDHRRQPSHEQKRHDRTGSHSHTSQEPPRQPLHGQDRPFKSPNTSDHAYIPGAFPSTDSIPHSNGTGTLRKKRSESIGSQSTVSQSSNFRTRDAPTAHPFRPGHEHRADGSESRKGSNSEGLQANGSLPPSLRAGRASPAPSESSREKAPATAKADSFRKGSSDGFRKGSSDSFRKGSTDSFRKGSSDGFRKESQDEIGIPKAPLLSNRSYQRSGQDEDSKNEGETTKGDILVQKPPDRVGNETSSLLSKTSLEPLKPGSRPGTASTTNNGYFSRFDKDTKASETVAAKSELPSLKPTQSITSASTSNPPSEASTPTEEFRPGLGPMIKKKSTREIASSFRRAATTANAFKPRAGGAGDKAQVESPTGGDGITGVFQAPSLLRNDTSAPPTPRDVIPPQPVTPKSAREPPSVEVTAAPTRETEPLSKPTQSSNLAPPKETEISETKPEGPRKRARADHSAKYAKALGIHASLLEGRTFEIEDLLNDFETMTGKADKFAFDELQASARKELSYVEAGSWLGAVENNDERVLAVGEMMDRVMAECEELDCLLTLYNVELSTLTEDVAYIEAQSQGLQVQTANQKLLHSELKHLLDTISINTADLRVLQDAPLTKAHGIQEIEHMLAQLYAAMLTIDPKMLQKGGQAALLEQSSFHRMSNAIQGASELSSMMAVKEKRDSFRHDSLNFIQRLKQYMTVKFRETEAETITVLERKRNNGIAISETSLDPQLRAEPRRALWLYSPLLLFVREVDISEWDSMIRMYETCIKKPYQDEFRDNLFAWKKNTRKPTGDEQDVLFTTTDKDADNSVGRKLTVKRAKSVRTDVGTRISSGDRPNDGKTTAYEAFAGALTETAKMIFVEQNFIIEVFHASSLDQQDFIDAIAIAPAQRTGKDLLVKKPFDTDRDMARRVLGYMEEIFASWPSEIQTLVEWAVKHDPLNSVGVLFALESQISEIEETNQEFLSQAISRIHDRLTAHFNRLIEEQVRGIEDTKVKIKKRKGLIIFIRIFPNFTVAVENMLPHTRSLDHLPIRGMVNDGYTSIIKAMFESLKFIAKESPTATGVGVSGDPEDKEALNHHILLIENMNYYIEEVPVRQNAVLEDWNFRARAELSEHMDQYLAAVIRRPLGKLLDYVESTETLIKNLPASQVPSSIATRASHSRPVFKKLLSSYDSKEIRRGAETLRKRVEKHFGENDDSPGLSRQLVGKVLKECESRYFEVTTRVERLIRDVYGGNLEVEWRREDVSAAFKR